MEIVTRRKPAVKDKIPFVAGTDVPAAPAIALWRTWTLCVLVCCVLTVSGVLGGHWVSLGSMTTTMVTVNFQQLSKLPAISSEDVGIPVPEPIRSIYVQDAVVLPTDVMLLVKVSASLDLEGNINSLECRFANESAGVMNFSSTPVLAIKPRTKDMQMVRCGLPDDIEFPSKFNSNVTLGIRESDLRVPSNACYNPARLPSWDALVYESLLDVDSLLLLAKGLATKSTRRIDVTSVKCVFGKNLPAEIAFESPVLIGVQEVFRCENPPVHLREELRGYRISIKASWLGILPSVVYYNPDNHPRAFLSSFINRQDFSSATAVHHTSISKRDDSEIGEEGEGEGGEQLAVPSDSKPSMRLPALDGVDEDLPLGKAPEQKRRLCACTMVWNKAQFIREWIVYHSFLGVEKYFVYDNDSDDDTEEVLASLASFNVSRMVWPWIKTQQAAFSHCTVLAREECEWVMFTDVDEYVYPFQYLRQRPSKHRSSDARALHRLIYGERDKADPRFGELGQIQFDCNNFGPSGLKSTPEQGVTVGYNCRTRAPERHKSILLLDAVNYSLLNVLHHFELQEGYQSVKLTRRVAVVNHYKYQAWDAFKMKFVRRAGTYTTDWQKSENTGSNDRTPGLGTEALKPDDWESRFCDVEDTGLRDFALRTFALPGQPQKMIWQVVDR